MPGRSKKQQEQEPPSIAIPRIFDQVQGSTANHQKNFVALHKVHLQAAKQVEPINNGKSVKLVGERAFEDAALDALTRVLPVKKGVAVADRVVKFMGGYVKFANEKAGERRACFRGFSFYCSLVLAVDGDQPEDEDEDEETTAARFVNRLLKHLLRGFSAKDKSVRFRCVGLVAEMVSYLGEIE
jgi:condensin complex subunit 3